MLLLGRSTQPRGSAGVLQWDRTFDLLVILKTYMLTLGVFCQPSGILGGHKGTLAACPVCTLAMWALTEAVLFSFVFCFLRQGSFSSLG